MTSRVHKKSETVDGYIKKFPKDVQSILQTIRKTIQKTVPKAEEGISYRIPAFKYEGKRLVYFAAFKEHIGMYPPAPKELKKETLKYAGPKGNFKFPLNKPMPLPLIKKIVAARAKTILAKTKKKK